MEAVLVDTELELLRYPTGRFSYKTPLSFEEAKGKIEEIKALPGRLREVVSRLSDEQLDTPYRSGGWTLRQVIHHLPDSHMNAYIRFRWTLTEDETTIKPYDENAWANLPDASSAPVEMSLNLLEALHIRWAALFDTLKPEDLDRTYIHPESGRGTIGKLVATYAWHGKHHLAHITSLIQRNNW
jgi:uncharacterized damage-inducible protein DinB